MSHPIKTLSSLFLAPLSLTAAEWSYTWPAVAKDSAKETAVSAEICPFKYGKTWAYAIEIDDGPKWVTTFAVPFFAQFHFTDAPPGVSGGSPRPFVGSVAAIASTIDCNDTAVNHDDFSALSKVGWGVINHSLTHEGRSWGDEAGRLSDRQVHEDAFWSQVLIAAAMPNGRAPTAAVYANGYTDYNRGDALCKVGIRLATRVGGSSPREVTSAKLAWMDFPRSYLDENAWTNEWSKSEVMADFPGAAEQGPAANMVVIDFTHDINRAADSANQQRWQARLSNIEKRWGAGGADSLWCAPSGDISDYVHAAAAATFIHASGKVTVRLPDEQPGTALTLKLTGIPLTTKLPTPVGGTLHRQGTVAWITSPLIGSAGTLPPAVHCVYDGKAGTIDLPAGTQVAGITLRIHGELPADFTYRIALRTAQGEHELPGRALHGGWFVASQTRALLPDEAALVASSVITDTHACVTGMRVWAVGRAASAKAKP